ncbi:FmdB family zinc ribbon protein [Tunturiibacter gelidoferens]|jgi:putative FmdB family regulatory protein|uniref:FmdB family regulatory protein n=1 Tax=Tunturiibacter gelidiferens TaxID=3069689 RepID=A0A9X0QAS8_9BACT|nr:zinc ribbon domain-containing protein [Edaphobacter lichenicola]MBB5326957.1 putative FmdB family regulatory protein [Edaphobacter lichenicola]
MPLYEYECTTCHKHTEKIQKFSDPEITVCPHCGGHLERVISAPAVSFKGGGWYADGYGNAKPKSSGDSNGSGSSTSDSKSGDSKSGDSKSASKSSTDSSSSGSSSPATAPSTPTAAPAASSSSDKK